MQKVLSNDAAKRSAKAIRLINVGYLFAIPLLVSLAIAALFYPGFMSYDTLHALRGARNGVLDSIYPPMVSYVWRTIDLISTNPSAMHFFQVFLLLASFFYISFLFSKRIKYSTVLLLCYISIPVILGSLAVIWKDVLMAAFFMSGFAASTYIRNINNKAGIAILSALSITLIFLGTCSRHNAIAGAVPLIFYLAWTLCARLHKSQLKLLMSTALSGLAIILMLFTAKTYLDKYSLPEMNRLPDSTQFFLRIVRIMDVAGASLCVGENLFSEMAPTISLTEIKSGYHPKHVNLSMDLVNKIGIDSKIDKIWVNVALQHPICFFYNKTQLLKHLIGANNKRQYIITAPYIIDNEYGYTLPESLLRKEASSYISHASWLPLFKPWFIYLASIIALVYVIKIEVVTPEYLTLFISGLFYFISLVIFGNAADGRLSFHTNTVAIMCIFASILEFRRRSRAKTS